MNDQIRKDELDGMYGFVGETRNVYKILIAKCDRWYEIALKHTTVVKSCDSKTLCNARYLNQLATVSGLCVCVCVCVCVWSCLFTLTAKVAGLGVGKSTCISFT